MATYHLRWAYMQIHLLHAVNPYMDLLRAKRMFAHKGRSFASLQSRLWPIHALHLLPSN